MALPAFGTVSVDAKGDHSGSGMALAMYLERKVALDGTILSQSAFTEGDADPVPLLQWLAADCQAQARLIHSWLTDDAEVEVDSPTDGKIGGVIK